jgi:peptide/nickel transport system substrate-binding protein
MSIKQVAKYALLMALAIFVAGCKPKVRTNVVVHELSDTDMLNPTNYQSAEAGYYLGKLFSTALTVDPVTLELVPSLVTELPVVGYDSTTGFTSYTYEIRPEAKWDNGTPITAKDALFSLKVYKCPRVDNEQIKPYFESIDNVILYPENERKYTIVCNKVYHINLEMSGQFIFIPAYVYDPKGLLEEFSLPDFNAKAAELAENAKIKEFATDYNSEKFQREKGFIIGSGPYEFDVWEPGIKVVLKKKKDWWGDALAEKGLTQFEANIDELVYKVVNDQTGAIVALKGLKLDVMHGIKPKDWVTDLTVNEKLKENFWLSTPPSMSYSYFGLNLRNPKFTDKNVRKALAHLVDVNKIIDVIQYNLAERVNGFMHPSKKIFYNDTITHYDYNIEKARQLLADAGWSDSNGNGTIDKMIDGQLTEFNITFTYNNGNDSRRDAALIFKEAAREVGINVDVVPQEWSIYIDNQKKHDFEMFYGAWISGVGESDPKQIFHTESINGGSNYGFFGNAESDAIIDALRGELDINKRAVYYKQLQAIIHDEVPYIFLFAPLERIAISKKFEEVKTTPLRPGYQEETFRFKQVD